MKVRIKFTKKGSMRFIGHLDTQRYFQRLNRRAGLNVAYSEGFSPHQKMSFAMPLSVGCESEGEYFDLELKDDAETTGNGISSESMIALLNSHSVSDIRVTECVMLPEKAEKAMASVRAADYKVCFREGYEPGFDLCSFIDGFNKAETFMVKKYSKKAKKKHKKKDRSNSIENDYKETDLKKLVYRIEMNEENNTVFMQVSAGSAENIKPELVIKSLYEKAGEELQDHALMITRSELYTDNMLPLYKAGNRF